jgi:hypothetical protein
VSTTITRRLFEGYRGNGGLFGRRRVREQADAKGLGQSWRDEAYKRLVDLHRNGKHAEAHAMLKGIEEADAEDEDEPDAPEDFEDQSQAGREEGPEKRGFANTASDEKGKESMESREAKVNRYLQHGSGPRHVSVLEGRCRKTPRQLADYARRLLRD